MPAPVIPRIKAQLRLTINRLRLLQEKNTALAKQNRREMAQLMEKGKLSSARIRVENIINEDIFVELLEALELYSEVALARTSMFDRINTDDRLSEAVYVLIYAAPHTDIKELIGLRELLAVVLPREFIVEAIENTSEKVPEKILKRIHPEAPSEELVDMYLLEIAKAYKVKVPGFYEPPETQEIQAGDKAFTESEKKPAATGSAGPGSDAKPAGEAPKTDDLLARFAALKKS